MDNLARIIRENSLNESPYEKVGKSKTQNRGERRRNASMKVPTKK